MKAPQELSETHPLSVPSAWLSWRSWRSFLHVLAPLAVVACWYWPSSRALAIYWNDTDNLTYTHGWMVLAITLWLLFDAVKESTPPSLHTSGGAAAALLVGGVVWLLAYQLNIQIVQLALLPLLGAATLWTLYGRDLVKRCGFALGYLFFAVPLWGEINPLLQWGTVFAMRAAVRIVGIPAYFEDNTIHLPSGVIAVEGGCSGLHFFIVGLALAALYWYVNRTAARWRLLLLAAALAVLANWVRVFVIVVAGYLTDMQHYLVRVEHYRFGWAVFAATMAVFFFMAHRMRVSSETHRAIAGSPAIETSSRASLALFIVAISIAPGYRLLLEHRTIPHVALQNVAPSGWLRIVPVANEWQPIFIHADASELAHFSRDGVQVDVYRALYAEQNQHKKLAGYDNSPLGTLRHGEVEVSTDNAPAPFTERELVDATANREIVWYAYYVDERWFSHALRAQMWGGMKALFGMPHAGVVALHARCESNCDAARRAMMNWTDPVVLQMLSAARKLE